LLGEPTKKRKKKKKKVLQQNIPCINIIEGFIPYLQGGYKSLESVKDLHAHELAHHKLCDV